MKKLLLFSTLFLMPSQGYAEDVSGPRMCDGNKGCDLIYLYPGRSAECSNKAVCIGIDSSLTCESGAVCVNFGKQVPTCKPSPLKPSCKAIPLESFCKWEGGKEIANKQINCKLRDILENMPNLPIK